MEEVKREKKKKKQKIMVMVREYDERKDGNGVEHFERNCEVGPSTDGKISIFTDLLGDPMCRVRNSPAFVMLVAEIADQIVGIVRCSIKTVTCGINGNLLPVYTKVAYILGLRVSPSHRRMGIGMTLVNRVEDWIRANGAEYSYLATPIDNRASVKLFTDKCGYSKFRSPAILVNPVFAHRISISNGVTIISLCPSDAEKLYRRRFSTTEFFPRDIDSVLNNKLNLGTFLAVPRGTYDPDKSSTTTSGLVDRFLSDPPASWAVLSVWNCKDVFTLQLRGVSKLKRLLSKTTRLIDKKLPFLLCPSVPELFEPFGLHFLYGLGGEGPLVVRLMKVLCEYAHNLARECACSVVATEVASREPLRLGVPHWKMLSCPEDLWCIKRLGEDYSDGSVGDWTKSPPGLALFVDPREF